LGGADAPPRLHPLRRPGRRRGRLHHRRDGRQAPEGLLGIHVNLLQSGLLGSSPPAESDKERAALAAVATFNISGRGYFIEQATRPQTIGYPLLDSPVALAA
jgi:hypothetical protein